MGAVLLLTPVVIAAWPTFVSVAVSAAASLGYASADAVAQANTGAAEKQAAGVEIEVANSEVITEQLGRDQKFTVVRDGVTITFRRDARGKAALSVSGKGRSDEQLRALGEELSQRLVRDYVYQQLMTEIQARDYIVVNESVDGSNAIHLTVRNWEN
jgi:ABC-type transporter MlaC component